MDHTRNAIDPSRGTTVAISLLLAVTGALLYGAFPGLVGPFRLKASDLIVARGPAVGITDRVVVIDIDEQSLEAFGQWPWSRTRLAALLRRIDAMQASAIALDFIMAEPDGTPATPADPGADGEKGPPQEREDLAAPQQTPDRVLAAVLSRGPFVLGYTFAFNDNHRIRRDCRIAPVEIVNPASSDRERKPLDLFRALGVVCNLPQLSRSTPHSGFLNGKPDGDERIRRLPLLIGYRDAVYPNLALAALLAGMGNPPVIIRGDSGGRPLLQAGPFAIPIGRRGHMAIRFPAKKSKLRHISAREVMSGRVDTAAVQGRIVLVGLSASGLTTTYATPGNGRFNAVEVQAQALETILSESHIRQSGNLVLVEILLALAAALLLGLGVPRLEMMPTIGIGLAGVAACWGGAQLLFNTRQVLMSPLLPASTITINSLVLLLYKYWFRQYEARRNLQEALAQVKSSQQELDSIVTTIPDIVYRLDATGRITFVSPAVAQYGLQPADLAGKHILDLVCDEDRDRAANRINERRTGPHTTSDLEIRLSFPPPPGGGTVQERYFSISAVGIYETQAGKARTFVGTQGIARDIGKRKQLEKQLRQAQKMEGMGSLAAGVAHDLNNILSGLVSYPELVLLELPADSPMRSKIETIQRSGKRAADIVQDLLMIARRGVEDYSPLKINQTIRDYLDSLEFKQMKRAHPAVRIETRLEEDVIPVKGSSVHLSKVVMNLVRNAVEAMPAGGAIRIRTTNRYLDTALDGYEQIPEGEYVVIRVVDEGVGIPKEALPLIFEPFYSKKRMDRSGSGLGMTVVWKTVKDHSGFLDLQSREGEGTCFDIYLPAARGAEVTVKNRVVLEDYTGNERILVVDDTPEQRDIAVRMLSRLGYRVEAAASGEKALTFLQEHPVDLVVLDMVMPGGLDGLETYRRILTVRPGQKAIIASGYATSDRVREMHTLGAGEYIRKPYTLEKIGLAVRHELDREVRK
jgi:PAS domain S-box-containing protein